MMVIVEVRHGLEKCQTAISLGILGNKFHILGHFLQ